MDKSLTISDVEMMRTIFSSFFRFTLVKFSFNSAPSESLSIYGIL